MIKTSHDKRWAHKLIERYQKGEKIEDYSLKLACEALVIDYKKVRADKASAEKLKDKNLWWKDEK